MTRSGLDIRMTILHEENALLVVFNVGVIVGAVQDDGGNQKRKNPSSITIYEDRFVGST
jgi:hypothetical protein